jgi:hypothetical protein
MEEALIEKSVFEEVPTEKIYSEKEINLATFMGGPLVAGYLMAENFKVFGDFNKVKKTWIIAVLSTILVFGLIFLIPESIHIPNVLFPLIYVGITSYFIKKYQEQKINEHLKNGGEQYNWWRTIAISIIGCIATVGVILSISFFNEAANGTLTEKTKNYGAMNHEIVYQSNVNENEADKIAASLTKATFFDDAQTKYVYLNKIGKNYEISIACTEEVASDPGAYQPFIDLKNNVQEDFPHNKIIFLLVVDNLENVIKRIE